MASDPCRRASGQAIYEDLCNRWRFDLADDILAHDVTLRASLGTTVTGPSNSRPLWRGCALRFRTGTIAWTTSGP